MPQSALYISTASRDALIEIARKHFKNESEILEKLIADNHDKMKNSFGRKILWKRTLSNQKDNVLKGVIDPLNISTMQGDDKPNNDVSNEIHIGGQLGMPEETKV